ncbi:MAG: hypothetical protein K2H60_06430 [Muribaculaceae bacterium]|nr:hypothetical protein [Muribaculaceae bacterium]
MKTLAKIILVVTLLANSVNSMRAEGFFFTVRGVSDNVWSSTILDVAEGLIHAASLGHVGVEGGYTVDIFNLKDNGEKIDVVGPKYWGFKARDLFGYMEFGTKIGWHGPYSPIGIYGQCYYNMRNQKIRFNHDFEEGRYKTDMLKLGAGIRVIPWFKDDGSLFLEVGSTYNMVMKCKTPYGKDKKQFKDGASTDFAVGYIWKRDRSNTTLSLGTNLNLYNYFNKEYSNDGGFYYPFANTKSTSLSVYVRIATFFTDW